ncbi:hypothetical protein TNCV_2323131 [Trichonephila clavipes]|nr:hypothetical protein TNCV_2323131 [Trichonephila clavipes]
MGVSGSAFIPPILLGRQDSEGATSGEEKRELISSPPTARDDGTQDLEDQALSKSGLCQYEIICGHTFVAKLTEKEKNWRGAYPRTEPTTPGTVAVQHNHQAKVITPFKRLLLADEDTTTVLLH